MNKEIRPNNIDKNPFITPDNYFDKLEDAILQKTLGEKDKKILPFTTPEDYFSYLEKNILENTIQKNEKHKSKIITFFTKKVYIASAVAASLIIAITIIGLYAFNANNKGKISIAQQNNIPADTFKDKLYVTNNNQLKYNNLPSDTMSEKQQEKSSFVSTKSKTKESIKSQNRKEITKISNKEKKTSEIIYKLYFEDDFPDLDEEYF